MDLEAGETYHSIQNCSVSFTWMAITLRQRFLKKRLKKKKKDLIYRILKYVIGKRTFRWHIKNGN